jgi:t-SNARE complex subunit (syntaxin)
MEQNNENAEKIDNAEVIGRLKNGVDHYSEVIEHGERLKRILKFGLWGVLIGLGILILVYVVRQLI